MAVSIEGKVVVITGAASGIGRASAEAFAREGARLALLDVSAEGLAALREQVASKGRAEPLALLANVAQDADLEHAVNRILSELGRVDVLVNNAGLGLGGRFEDQDPARLRRMVEVNLYGLMRLTQLVLPAMRAQREGHVLNVSSQAGFLGVPGYAGYVATKAGVTAFTQVLRRELEGSGVFFTLVYPGPTRTAMTESMIRSRKGTGRMPHHGPELVAARIVDAVRERQAEVVIGPAPRIEGLMRWGERVFPGLLDRYWRAQLSGAYYEGAAQSGVTPAKPPEKP